MLRGQIRVDAITGIQISVELDGIKQIRHLGQTRGWSLQKLGRDTLWTDKVAAVARV